MDRFRSLKDTLVLIEKRITLIRNNCPVYGEKKIYKLAQEKEEILKQLFDLHIKGDSE